MAQSGVLVPGPSEGGVTHSDCGWRCGCAGKTEIHWEHVLYHSASEVMIHYEEALYQVYATLPVMWCETVGLRTRPVWDRKNRSWSCTLWSWSVLQAWCCVEKHGLITLVIVMILKDTATFQVGLVSCKYTVTLKPGLVITQGHRNRHGSIRHVWRLINVP